MSLSEAPRTSDVGERPEEVEEEEEKEEGEAEEAEELSALERFHAKLQEHGVDIEPVDLPRAIVIHEVLGLSFFVGTLGACYALQPTQRLASSRWAQRVKAELARRAEPSSQAQGTATAAAAAAADRRGSWFSARWTKAKSFLSRFMSPRMVVALGEQAVARHVLRPVLIPLKLVTTFQALSWLKTPSRNGSPETV